MSPSWAVTVEAGTAGGGGTGCLRPKTARKKSTTSTRTSRLTTIVSHRRFLPDAAPAVAGCISRCGETSVSGAGGTAAFDAFADFGVSSDMPFLSAQNTSIQPKGGLNFRRDPVPVHAMHESAFQ
jgi:hypothetical protein